jgi:hypothetical protein
MVEMYEEGPGDPREEAWDGVKGLASTTYWRSLVRYTAHRFTLRKELAAWG